ncbi:MAG: DASS family sodium-coupled anion symporter [Bacteroidetes bacterium]|nr:DASS family sodium-coupled anion symporter [Bacteroidota bacterium]
MDFQKKIGLFFAPFCFVAILLLPAQWGLKPEAWRVLAVAVLMLVWWVSEAVPFAVTSLLPLVLFPLLNVNAIKAVGASYGDPIVFLFLGGFLLALAMEKWNLHRRIALTIVHLTGTNANGIVLGFMIATAVMSMWISNTATTIMMLPIALSVITLLVENNLVATNPLPAKGMANFSKTIMLGIAYAASIGGMATLIGTPPNVVFKGYMEKNHGYAINFFDWMIVGVPLMVLLVLATYFINVKLLFPNRLGRFEGARELIQGELAALGKPSVAEKRVFWLFMVVVALWVSSGFLRQAFPGLKISDEVVAIIAAIALFVIPVDFKNGIFLLDWGTTSKMPWGILLLFGGGLALADGLYKTGIIDLIGNAFHGNQTNRVLFVLALTTATLLLSELMSNVALVVVFLPVVSGIAQGAGFEPIHLAVPVTLAASCGFMLPMATPPNAIVFGSGHLKVFDMVRAGLWLDILSILLITLFAETVVLWVF